MQTCEQCGQPIENDRRFCSIICRNRNNNSKRARPPLACELCGSPITSHAKRFCSVRCRNTALAHAKERKKGIVCPRCGSYKYYRKMPICAECYAECSPAERDSYNSDTGHTAWIPEELTYLTEHYSEDGAELVADALGKTPIQVRDKANRLGLRLSPDATARIVHSAARAYMLADNPMKRAEVVEKIKEWRKTHDVPYDQLVLGKQRYQREHPSALERILHKLLGELNIEFEAAALIPPWFLVDVRIGSLILQADGEYWHGHPRFEPLTERQESQRSRDRGLDAFLAQGGYTVVRIWENDLNKSVLVDILRRHGVIAS